MKVEVTKIYWGEVETQYGKSQKLGIKTNVHGDKWLSCFENKTNTRTLRAIQEGQTIEIVVEKKGDFLNFRPFTRFDQVERDVAELKAAVFGTGKAEQKVEYPEPGSTTTSGENVPEPEDIPF